MSHGYGPSIREIAIAVNLRSTSTVHAHVERLKKAGMLTTSEEKPQPRTIVPTEKLYELIHMEHDEIPAVAQKSYVQGAALINPYLDPMIFANSLRALREALHLSREQVAEKTGLSYNLICAHERGEVLPRENTIRKYAAALNVPMITPHFVA